MVAATTRDPLDRDYTPFALSRALVRLLPLTSADVVLEPHVGAGSFAEAILGLSEPPTLWTNDIDPAAPGLELGVLTWIKDFEHLRPRRKPSWAVGNPPFSRAEAHIDHALQIADNVAFLLRLNFLGSKGRIPFFEDNPPSIINVIQGRPGFRDGQINPKNNKPYGTDGCEYAFFEWRKDWTGPTEIRWVSWNKPKRVRA